MARPKKIKPEDEEIDLFEEINDVHEIDVDVPDELEGI